jgi:hypothetical protein
MIESEARVAAPAKPGTHGQAAPGSERAGLGVEGNTCDRLADLESVLVDAETENSSVERLARNSQLIGGAGRPGDPPLALRERRFHHLALAIGECPRQGNEGTGRRYGFLAQPACVNRERRAIGQDHCSLDNVLKLADVYPANGMPETDRAF